MVHLHVGEKENAQGETLSVRGEPPAIDYVRQRVLARPLSTAERFSSTAAYAKAFLSDPKGKKFAWFGLAAIASNDVGLAMRQLNSEDQVLADAWAKEVEPVRRVTGPVDTITFRAIHITGDALAKGNRAVFDDIYWQNLAYSREKWTE
jgi:hypothetical protein